MVHLSNPTYLSIACEDNEYCVLISIDQNQDEICIGFIITQGPDKLNAIFTLR